MSSDNVAEEQTPPPGSSNGGLIRVKELQREIYLNRVLHEVSNISNYLNFSIHQLEVKLSLLEHQLQSFEAVQGQLESLDESQFGQDHRLLFEDAYFKLKSYILERLSAQKIVFNDSPMTSTHFTTTTLQHSTKPHLPTLQLPKFSGNYNDWNEFYNMFCILVHENSELSSVSKFQYLRSCLSDNASRLIQSLDITPDNYNQAIDILRSRYDNKRLIFQSHIEKIFAIKDMSKPKVSEVREFIDSVNANIRALKSIASIDQISDGIILYMMTSKLDLETQAKWEEEVFTNWEKEPSEQPLTLPKWNDLSSFLERRCKTLEIVSKPELSNLAGSSHGRPIYSSKQVPKTRITNSSFTAINQTTKCCFCNTSPTHNAFHCSKFIEMDTYDRFRAVKRLKLCINCLGTNHIANTCPSTNRCQHCNAAHHTLLHKDQAQKPSPAASNMLTTTACNPSIPPAALQVSDEHSQVILGTARVKLQAPNGRSIIVRALLDSGSQLHFVTKKIAQYLHVPYNKTNIQITGIASKSSTAYNTCFMTLNSCANNFSSIITAVVIPSITSYQPQTMINIKDFDIPMNVKLADEHFFVPGPIDLLIGAGLFYDLLMVGQIKNENMPLLQKTTLGWIVTGANIKNKAMSTVNKAKLSTTQSLLCTMDSPSNSPQSAVENELGTTHKLTQNSDALFTFTCLHNSSKQSYLSYNTSNEPLLNELMERFWKIEETSCEPHRTIEDDECERFFEETTTRCPTTKKFIVRLPFRQSPDTLGSSLQRATKRFYSLEKRLCDSEGTSREYCDFIHEYIKLGHMAKASSSVNSNFNYIPHHCVIKPESSTTKLRVVFDGSCPTSNGISLNSILRVGPTLQDDIFSIMSRFRFHKFVLVADIAKMYRQVLVAESDIHWQSIVWRDNPSEALSTYVLKTVTYGTRSAPYLAVKCMQVLAKEEALHFPIGSKVTLRDFYVDNLMTGGNSVDEVLEIKRQVIEVLKEGGFPLRKFASNCESILINVPASEREEIVRVDDSGYIKTLGLKWSPQEDSFSYIYNQDQRSSTKITKRIILSSTAKLFDPLGLVNPIVVRCKILLQHIWSLKMHWDESLPQSIVKEWEEIHNQLITITKIQLPRYVIINTNTNLHVFADASLKAYGACIYAVTNTIEGTQSALLCSKSRVAPLNSTTLPRLELCAALLATQLLKSVLRTMPQPPQHIICWSDSSITLCWISGDPSRWKPFVKHRVEKIKQSAPNITWRHIPSQFNPADILSRGTTITHLTTNDLWFKGPEFLIQDESTWPTSTYTYPEDANCEMRRIALTVTTTKSIDLLHNHKFLNNYEKLVRIFVYVIRYALSIMFKKAPKTGPIVPEEMRQSLEFICRLIQGQAFAKELKHLKSSQQINRQSKLLALAPFLHNGLILVGGRLKNSSLPFSAKHPILLPSTHQFVNTIIRYHHHQNLHAGAQTLHNILRNNMWILKAKQTIRQVIHNCIMCYRFRPLTEQQIMGALPADRVTESYPFAVSGVDFCGPFHITQKIRGRAPIKVYMAVFICFSVKAVHLELVPDLTTNAFIAAIKRFVARRGRCSTIYSDNATNFLGANNELKELLQHFLSEQHNEEVYKNCRQYGIEWKFIPPRSPHFGGLWESAVKMAKHYMCRTIGNYILTYDELHTVSCQAEAIINSRPLSPMSSDPNDFSSLTPAHFLIGRPLSTILEPSSANVNPASLKRYHILRWVQQQFWDRWRNEYLTTLQQRTKWTTIQDNVKQNDLVLLKEDSVPPLKWPLGRVIETYPGNDGQVRVVSVKTANGVYKRAIAKVCKLPVDTIVDNPVESNASKGGRMLSTC